MEALQYVSLILANHRWIHTRLRVESYQNKAPCSLHLQLAPPPPPRHLAWNSQGGLDASNGSTGPWWWREVSKLSLTKVWFLVSEALKCGSVKKKWLRKNDTSLLDTSTFSELNWHWLDVWDFQSSGDPNGIYFETSPSSSSSIIYHKE